MQNGGKALRTKFNKKEIHPKDRCRAESRRRGLLVGTPGPAGVCCKSGGGSGPQRSCRHLPPEGRTSERPKANKGYRRRVGGHRAVPGQEAGASETAAVITQGFSEFPAALPGHWRGPRCQGPAGLPRSMTGPGWIASNLLQPMLSPRLQR